MSKTDGHIFGAIIIAGVAVFIALWLILPPAMVLGLFALVAAINEWDVNYLHSYGALFCGWIGLHVACVAIPFFFIKTKLWNKAKQ